MRLIALVSLLSVGCLPVIGDGGVDCDAMAVASTQVTVEDTDGNAIDGVEVELVGEGPCESWQAGEWVCGWERSGELTIRADAPGFAANEVTVEVPQGECHVQTQQVTVVLDRVNCPDELVFGVHVQTVSASGEAIPAKVEWLPLDGMNHTSPMRCEELGGDAYVYACAEQTGGEIEIWATSREHGSFYDVVDVPMDDCGPITQSITGVVDRDPG